MIKQGNKKQNIINLDKEKWQKNYLNRSGMNKQ